MVHWAVVEVLIVVVSVMVAVLNLVVGVVDLSVVVSDNVLWRVNLGVVRIDVVRREIVVDGSVKSLVVMGIHVLDVVAVVVGGVVHDRGFVVVDGVFLLVDGGWVSDLVVNKCWMSHRLMVGHRRSRLVIDGSSFMLEVRGGIGVGDVSIVGVVLVVPLAVAIRADGSPLS